MYNQIIKDMHKGTKIKICGKEYIVQTKTYYANLENKNLKYVKFILNNHKILVINPARKAIFLGEIVADFYKDEYFPDRFEWQGKTFSKFEKDIQIVRKIQFGQPQQCEGECVWVDYSCDQDSSICVDMAYIYREKKES